MHFHPLFLICLDECLAAQTPLTFQLAIKLSVRDHPVEVGTATHGDSHIILIFLFFSIFSALLFILLLFYSLVNERLFTFIAIVIASLRISLALQHFAAAPHPPSLQMTHNSNSSAPGRESSSNLTSGTAGPLPPSYPQHAPMFRAPAPEQHRRAPHHHHHLHSIPPREKSTRTLIVDHLLWVHAVTRFAQARAELAMTDRTGGPGTPNFERRERPEQWDENDVVSSEGEQEDVVDGREIRSCSGESELVDGQEEVNRLEMTSRQDLPHARKLRQRADSLENVIISMLEQPTRDPPFFAQDEPTAPVSPLVRFRFPLATRLHTYTDNNIAATTSVWDAIARQEAHPSEWRPA